MYATSYREVAREATTAFDSGGQPVVQVGSSQWCVSHVSRNQRDMGHPIPYGVSHPRRDTAGGVTKSQFTGRESLPARLAPT